MLWASLWCSNCKNIDYSVFLVSLFQVRKCQLKNENNQVLEIQMLCITQRIVLFLLYCFILVYSFIFLSFYCFGDTFDNVLVPASIWRWSAQQYSATFAFKCCRPSYLTIRGHSQSCRCSNQVSSYCVQSHAGLPHYFHKSARFNKGICSCHLKLVMRQTWVAKIFHGHIAICEKEA